MNRTRSWTDTDRAAASRVLSEAGIGNPARIAALAQAAVQKLDLDLCGAVVVTEAASGPFVVTPVLAALGGATRTIGLTRESPWATADQVRRQTAAFAVLCGIDPSTIEIRETREPEL